MQAIEGVSRRGFLKQSLALAATGFRVIDHGPIKPSLELPRLIVTPTVGQARTLLSITRNHITALQLMFTTCTTTCPMQGAIFERVQDKLPDMASRGIQLISLSVDPKNDNPKAMMDWLSMFHAGPAWIGATPEINDLPKVRSFFGVGTNALDPHSTQTHILDRLGRLVYRTGELPPPEQIVNILQSHASKTTPDS